MIMSALTVNLTWTKLIIAACVVGLPILFFVGRKAARVISEYRKESADKRAILLDEIMQEQIQRDKKDAERREREKIEDQEKERNLPVHSFEVHYYNSDPHPICPKCGANWGIDTDVNTINYRQRCKCNHCTYEWTMCCRDEVLIPSACYGVLNSDPVDTSKQEPEKPEEYRVNWFVHKAIYEIVDDTFVYNEGIPQFVKDTLYQGLMTAGEIWEKMQGFYPKNGQQGTKVFSIQDTDTTTLVVLMKGYDKNNKEVYWVIEEDGIREVKDEPEPEFDHNIQYPNSDEIYEVANNQWARPAIMDNYSTTMKEVIENSRYSVDILEKLQQAADKDYYPANGQRGTLLMTFKIQHIPEMTYGLIGIHDKRNPYEYTYIVFNMSGLKKIEDEPETVREEEKSPTDQFNIKYFDERDWQITNKDYAYHTLADDPDTQEAFRWLKYLCSAEMLIKATRTSLYWNSARTSPTVPFSGYQLPLAYWLCLDRPWIYSGLYPVAFTTAWAGGWFPIVL